MGYSCRVVSLLGGKYILHISVISACLCCCDARTACSPDHTHNTRTGLKIYGQGQLINRSINQSIKTPFGPYTLPDGKAAPWAFSWKDRASKEEVRVRTGHAA